MAELLVDPALPEKLSNSKAIREQSPLKTGYVEHFALSSASPQQDNDLLSPTEDEKKTLHRIADPIPWNAYCI